MTDIISTVDTGKSINLSEDVRLALSRELGKQFSDSWSGSNDLREMVKERRDLYEGLLDDKPVEAAWSSNINVPLTKHQIRTTAIKIANSVFEADPIFDVEALDPVYDEVAAEEENWNQYWHEATRLKSKGYLAILDQLITGQVWLKPGVRSTGKVLPDLAMMMPGQPLKIDQLDYEPTCSYIVTEDMMLCPCTAPSFEHAKGAFARTTLRWNDIIKARKSKVFYPDAVERVKLTWMQEHGIPQPLEQAGIAEVTPVDLWSASFECWEGVYRWVKPGEDEEREWLILAAYNVGSGGDPIILKCVPYREVYGDDWFFIPIITEPKPNSMWGGSLVEAIRGLQNFTNAMYNGCIDAISLNLLPPIAVGASASRRNLVWEPMAKWDVSPNDVAVIPSSQSTFAAVNAGLNMIEMTRDMAERTTGTSDPTSGRPSEGQHTKYEIGLVAQAGDRILEHQVVLTQIGGEDDQGLEAYARLMMQIIRKFLPSQPIQYRSKGEGGSPWKTVNPEWHQGNYKFVAHGNTNTSNPETRFQRAMALSGEMSRDPFTLPSPFDTAESVLEKMQRLYKARMRFYQSMGEKHPEGVIGSEPQTFEEAICAVANINPQVAQFILTTNAARQQAEQMGGGGGMVSAGGFGRAFPGAGAGGGQGNAEGIPGFNIPSGMAQA